MEWIEQNIKPTGTWTKYEIHKHLSEDVLISNDMEIFIGRWNRESGYWETDEPSEKKWIDDVTHWMPLPKNPKRGNRN